MKESSTLENNTEKEQKESDYSGNFPALLTFLLKNGQKIIKTAFLEKGQFPKLKDDVLEQLTNPEKEWFYFVEYDSPHTSSLIKIEDISCFTIEEYDEMKGEDKARFLDEYRNRLNIRFSK